MKTSANSETSKLDTFEEVKELLNVPPLDRPVDVLPFREELHGLLMSANIDNYDKPNSAEFFTHSNKYQEAYKNARDTIILYENGETGMESVKNSINAVRDNIEYIRAYKRVFDRIKEGPRKQYDEIVAKIEKIQKQKNNLNNEDLNGNTYEETLENSKKTLKLEKELTTYRKELATLNMPDLLTNLSASIQLELPEAKKIQKGIEEELKNILKPGADGNKDLDIGVNHTPDNSGVDDSKDVDNSELPEERKKKLDDLQLDDILNAMFNFEDKLKSLEDQSELTNDNREYIDEKIKEFTYLKENRSDFSDTLKKNIKDVLKRLEELSSSISVKPFSF